MSTAHRTVPFVGAAIRCRLSPTGPLLALSIAARGLALELLRHADAAGVVKLPPAVGPRGAPTGSRLARVCRLLRAHRGENGTITAALEELRAADLVFETDASIVLSTPVLDSLVLVVDLGDRGDEGASRPSGTAFPPTPNQGGNVLPYLPELESSVSNALPPPPNQGGNGFAPGDDRTRTPIPPPSGRGGTPFDSSNARARAVTGTSSLGSPPPPAAPSPRARASEDLEERATGPTGTLSSSGTYRDQIGAVLLRCRELEGVDVPKLIMAVDGIGATKAIPTGDLVEATKLAAAELAIKVATAEKPMNAGERARYLLRCIPSSADRAREQAKHPRKSGGGGRRPEPGEIDLAFEVENVRKLSGGKS